MFGFIASGCWTAAVFEETADEVSTGSRDEAAAWADEPHANVVSLLSYTEAANSG